ncbi:MULTISPECIES: hypothetical protein [unclassified Streptomyces]|uniref:hypothetical protein n=1 Tax=unclassified Streptomyces TaxID=2593676 RepID=UPI0034094FD0
MNSTIARIGDRVLERLIPKATAQADTSFYQRCYCRGLEEYKKLCHVVGGTSSCSGCIYYAICV